MTKKFKQNLFYISFFLLYFLFIYLLLYQNTGLSPFQVNIYFFSNAIASISQRFLIETAPYALLFYLIFYIRQKIIRIGLIAIFLLIFSINFIEIAYYFVTQANIQLYIIKGIRWYLFLSYMNTKTISLLFFLIISIFLLAYFLYSFQSEKKISWKKHFFLSGMLFGLIIYANFSPISFTLHKTIMSSDKLAKKQARLLQLENSGLIDLTRELKYEKLLLQQKPLILSEEEKDFLHSIKIDEKLNIHSDFHPKKIVLIVTESLSQLFLSHYNPELQNSTPFIDQLIDNNPHMDTFYPSGTYTIFGLASLLCSHTNLNLLRKDENYNCLPNILNKNHYWTEFIRGFSKYYIGENVFFNKMGYKTITAQEDFNKKFPDFKNKRPDLYNKWGFSDDYLFNEVIHRLKEKKDEKLFLTVLTVDTHANGGRCYKNIEKKESENPVLFSVKCFDSALKDFFEKLKEENLFDDDLLIILTADHLYPNFSGIPGNVESTGFTSQTAHIPLVFISKNSVNIKAQQGSQIDLSPSILDLLDVDSPNYYMGKSLFANKTTIPMGQDRMYFYMMPQNHFFGFNLLQNNIRKNEDKKIHSDYLRLSLGTLEEIELNIEKRRRESSLDWNTNTALFKWYKNHFYLKAPTSNK